MNSYVLVVKGSGKAEVRERVYERVDGDLGYLKVERINEVGQAIVHIGSSADLRVKLTHWCNEYPAPNTPTTFPDGSLLFWRPQ